MNIKIYQINSDRDINRALFLAFDQLEKFTGSRNVDSSIYDKTFEGDVDCKGLESVFQMFNTNRPPEFTGHSLSKSDIVEVCEKTNDLEPGFYYCDSFGFKKIDFEPEKTQIKDAKRIKVVMIEPEKEARIVELEEDLRALQHAVRGDIETMYPFEEQVAIVCNGKGKMTGFPLNRAIYMDGEMIDIIAGNFFICATPPESEHFESLSDEQVKKYMNMFKEPERFYRGFDGRIKAQKIKSSLKDVISEAEKNASDASQYKENKSNELDI